MTLPAGLTLVGVTRLWRSSMGDIRQSITARNAAGQTFRGTAFADGHTILTPNHPNNRST